MVIGNWNESHPDSILDQSLYLQRYAYPGEFLKGESISPELGMVVTIPCYNEPNLIDSLNALHQCQRPTYDVEVIVLINQSENSDAEVEKVNERTFHEALQWTRWHQSPSFRYYVLWVKNMPEKWSGVGLARKMAMDEAVRRFRKVGNPTGIILGFDADCTCQDNYLVAIEKEFQTYQLYGASIHFEHPTYGAEDRRLYDGIINYELHLRYYILAQRYAGFPYAFHAVGSSMAVRSDVYEKQGGMSRRKAGEDFYFLHKIIPLGHYKEIIETRVIPSPRESNRVPFGTGKAMQEWMKRKDRAFKTYDPEIFEALKQLFDRIPDFHDAKNDDLKQHKLLEKLPDPLKAFLEQEKITEKLGEIHDQSNRLSTFSDRFFNWFDGLKLLQYVHFAQSRGHSPVPLEKALHWLETKYPIRLKEPDNLRQILTEIRDFNINNPAYYAKGSDLSNKIK